jgi:hypothetical protein
MRDPREAVDMTAGEFGDRAIIDADLTPDPYRLRACHSGCRSACWWRSN